MSRLTTNKRMVLVGYPNCGKSTLFNALTGGRAKTGNWAGVTVEIKHGELSQGKQKDTLFDLPGITSLTHLSDEQSLDSHLVHAFLREEKPDVLINVIDASQLQTQLYLTMQLREMQIPMVVVVNMMDQIEKEGSVLALDTLAEKLACPVLPVVGTKRQGIDRLQKAMIDIQRQNISPSPVVYPELVEDAIDALNGDGEGCDRWEAIQCLCGDYCVLSALSLNQKQLLSEWQSACGAQLGQEIDLLIIDTLYTWINSQMQVVLHKNTQSFSTTDYLDSLVLHRYWGIPIFIAIMYGMFVFAISIIGGLQDSVGMLTEWIAVDGTAVFLHQFGAPESLIHLLSEGVGRGINTTLTFLPVLVGIYLYLGFLEGSGYMPRAAFVMDRLMQFLGLPGNAFVPLIIGFGCNVPAVMATRTLASPKDRLMTSMMVPFMSCSARLAIFSVFAGAFFPVGGHNVIFCLYLLGIVVALLTGLMLRTLLARESETPLLMTFPSYHWPRPSVLFRQVYWRVMGFIKRAGRIIIPLSLVLSLLSLPVGREAAPALHTVGKAATVLLKPMGVDEENWPATVGLVSGVIAKEVVIGTMNTLYTHESKWGQSPYANSVKGYTEWMQKGDQVKQSFLGLFGRADLDESTVQSDSALGRLSLYFHDEASVIAYLLFVLLYFPCLSTLAVIVREVSKPWAVISVFWATGLAYVVAISAYQLLTIQAHVMSSLLWIAACIASVFVGYWLLSCLWRHKALGLDRVV